MSGYLETIASYLPALLRQHLAEHPAPLNAPHTETFSAAFMFGDITGFTPLTARLTQRGAEGVEELSRLLNGYFDQLIAIITTHGGDILKIAGDGVLAVWPARDEALGTAVLRAAQCAQVIQAELHNYEVLEDTRLAMRIGLGAGPLTVAQLGGVFGRWEALATGVPILQASRAEERCQPGQVILAPEAWALAQDALGIELVEKEGKQALRLLTVHQPLEPSPTRLLPLLPQAESAARAYIPGAILQRLAAGQTTFLAELRRLTVIFVNLPDFERLDNLNDAQTLMQTLQRAIYRYEGGVNQLIMDDKGITLLAALGLPPFAHEDDPVRGLLAALEVANGLRSLKQRYAIGVTSGQVYCGERGNDLRREYALMGDAVNTSARLMQAILKSGNNDVYCDAATWQAAKGRLDFDTLNPTQIKGKTEPLPVYRPKREKIFAPHQQAELIGREAEKGLLSDALKTLSRGEIQGPLIIEGEAGLGKSRLVEEALSEARAIGLSVFSGTGDALERTTAYHVWRNILREGFGLLPADSLEEQRKKVEAALPERWRSYAPLLDVALPLKFPETGATSVLRPQARLDRTRDMLDDLLNSLCSRAPTVLVLEDAHWFDTASWSTVTVASRLARKIPLLVLLTTRPLPEPYPSEYLHLLEEPGSRPLRLSPLDEAETTALISQCLQTNRVGINLKEFVQQRAEGNPFFAEEILLALREAGTLQQISEGCDLKPGAAAENIGLPETVQGLIANRIDRLKPAEQMTLKVASVLGRIFAAETVRAVYPMEAGRVHVDQCLRNLQERDFIVPTSPGNFVFKRTSTREAIYNQMLFAQRRQLHQAVAEWVEQTYAEALEPHYALLAHHWRHTLTNPQDEPTLAAKALDYLEKAGEQAIGRLTYLESAEFFSRALGLAERLGNDPYDLVSKLRKMRWLTALGIAQVNLGRLAGARKSLEQVARLGGSIEPTTNFGFYLATLWEAGLQAWHRLRPNWLRLGIPDEIGQQHGVVSEAFTWLFQPYLFNGQFFQAILSSFKAVNIAEGLQNPPATLSTAYGMLSYIARIARQEKLARLYERLALNTAIPSNEPTLQSGLDVLLASSYIGQGQWEQVQAHGEKALVILERQEAAYRARGNLLTQLAFADFYQGRYLATLEKTDMVRQIGRISNDVEFLAWGLLGQVLVYFATGQFKTAQDDLVKIERLLPEIPGSGLTHLLTQMYRARLAFVQQNWELAEYQITRLAQRYARSPFAIYADLDSKIIRAEVSLALWRRADQPANPAQVHPRRAAARRACQALEQFARFYPVGQAAALRCWGDYHWLNGKTAPAQRHWLASLATAQALSMPHEDAQAHWALAQIPGAEQAAHRQAARDILEPLGATAYFTYLEETAREAGQNSTPV